MGQGISKAVNPPPLTLTHCFVDGNVDMGRYYVYKRRRLEQDTALSKCHMNAKKTKKGIQHSSYVEKEKEG